MREIKKHMLPSPLASQRAVAQAGWALATSLWTCAFGLLDSERSLNSTAPSLFWLYPYKQSACSFFFKVLCGFMKTPDAAEC